MEPNANFPGNTPYDPNGNPSDSGRLTPNFSSEPSGEPAGIPPFKPASSTPPAPPISPTPITPAPMPTGAAMPPQPSPMPQETIAPPPPPSLAAPASRQPAPGVVNYGLSGIEEGSKISAGAPSAQGSVPSPASFSIPTPPPQQQASFAARQEGVTPPPGAGDVVIRTLGSDLESLKESGGLGIQTAPVSGGATPPIPNISKSQPSSPQNNAAPSKGQEAVNPYSFEGGPMFMPQTDQKGGGKKGTSVVSKKTIETAIIGLVVIGVLAAAYFFLLPKLFPSPNKAVTTPITIPTSTSITENSTPPPFEHHSFFTTTSTSEFVVDLPALSLADISSALGSVTSTTSTPAKTVVEVQMTYNKDPLQTTQILPVLLPNASSTLAQYFSNDFTSFLYYDGTAAWPGYIFELNPAYSSSTAVAVGSTATQTPTTLPTGQKPAPTPTETISGMVKSVVESANLSDVYLEYPGKLLSNTWANGSLPNKSPVRYARFSKTGRVFEYGWFGNYLILSTSYSGIVQAEGMLQSGS